MKCDHTCIILVVFAFLCFHLCSPQECISRVTPEQIHLSLGNGENEFIVTWVTFISTDKSLVWYGTVAEGFTNVAEGCSSAFIDGGCGKVTRYIHRVLLHGLKPNTYYVYSCGSFCGVSRIFLFKTNPCGSQWSPRVIIYGDMGSTCAYTLPYIYQDVQEGSVDAIIHVGDIAYNLETHEGFVGDEFMKLIEPVASRVPYMVAPGNHEQAYNFSHFRNRYTMPGKNENLFYSFNLGPVHFVVISTEVYYFTQYGYYPLVNQLKWLDRDLRIAAHPISRRIRPWIVILGHRPMYCSSNNNDDCAQETNVLRFCLSGPCDIGLENLFHRYQVDIAFWGHMHYYERSWPLFAGQVYNGSYYTPYLNPRAAVHIITGAAGMSSGTETVKYVCRERFPFYSNHYSYTRLTAINDTVLHVEQVSATSGGSVIDSFCIVKDICQ